MSQRKGLRHSQGFRQSDFVKSKIFIECTNPEKVISAIEPDMDNNYKFDVKIDSDKNGIFLGIESNDISGLLAGINSYLKLIKAVLSARGVGKDE